jgi:PAS domain-containing protein
MYLNACSHSAPGWSQRPRRMEQAGILCVVMVAASMTLTTRAGRPIEAEGRAIGGRAVLRLRDVSGIEQELLDRAARHDQLLSDVETMSVLLDSSPAPVWVRDKAGQLVFKFSLCSRGGSRDLPML